jgi:broad specificity phosphatase PhoE
VQYLTIVPAKPGALEVELLTPHGGESFADVMTRVSRWTDGLLAGSVIRAAIAHALGAGPENFRHIDVAPLTRTKLSGGGGRWTLAAMVSLKDER